MLRPPLDIELVSVFLLILSGLKFHMKGKMTLLTSLAKSVGVSSTVRLGFAYITVSNSPNPSRVYIRLCKHRKKVFYCFYKITLPRKNAKLFVMALIKREILTSRKVLYTKSCTRNQFLFCKKMLSKIRIFLA